MLSFPLTSLATTYPGETISPVISQNSHLHIVNWPHDILRIIGRLLPQEDAIKFTSSCVLLFTLRYKAGGHGIFYAQYWKRIPSPREALHSVLNLEDRTPVAWSEVKHYAPAITAVTLDFQEYLSQSKLAPALVHLKDLTNLMTLNIPHLFLQHNILTTLLRVITENGSNKLRSLTIGSNKLTTLPAELEQLKLLQTLILRTRRLAILPTVLWKLTHLRSLLISSDCLTTLPAELGQLQHLQNLTIESGMLTTLPAKLEQLQHLQNLTIDSGSLTTLPSELGQLQNLQNLNIRARCLTSLPAELGQLQSLQSLTIHSYNLTTLPSELGQLQHLQDLTITAHSLISLPSELGQLQHLQNLTIYAPYLLTLSIEMEKLQSLQSLHISTSKSCVFPPEIDYLEERGVKITRCVYQS